MSRILLCFVGNMYAFIFLMNALDRMIKQANLETYNVLWLKQSFKDTNDDVQLTLIVLIRSKNKS